ncbi:MAG: right-handed parallel beta-helix repeat-containing protein, partial [Chloroflexi bacterium]|nr:right-handed parallel beta-helix repeat-containing protein [Chloroflexota bacterium]
IANGSYMMGYGAPGTESCEADSAFGCHMPPIPGGPDPDQPTRIVGEGWGTGCTGSLELWGTERAWFVLNLTDSSNVEVACLEISDHSTCVEFHSGELECNRDVAPFGEWAAAGIYAEDSSNVLLQDLNIHGLASTGIQAGRLTDWTVENVRIAANGWVGWDGDIDGDDSNTGVMTFRNWIVEWNGCGETYPDEEPVGCWAQSAGGYGDGVGTGATGGDWIIEDSQFLFNTSDGLDLLYHSEGGVVTLNRIHAEGNAGNQVKVTGSTILSESVLIGNCAFFENQLFTFQVDACRALGNTLHLTFTGGEQVEISNSMLYGQGDGLIGAGPREGYTCTGAETIVARNDVFVADLEFLGDGEDVAFLFYQEECGNLALDSDFNTILGAKNVICNDRSDYVISGEDDFCVDSESLADFPLQSLSVEVQEFLQKVENY